MQESASRRRFMREGSIAAVALTGAAASAKAENRGAKYLCVTCGTQYPESANPPEHCPICEDERQYVGPDGQQWTTLDQIRKTSIERGKMSLVNAQGQTEQVNYVSAAVRGENLDKEKIRIDQEYPSIKYSLVYSDAKTFGLYNDAIFTPRGDATQQFENRIFHGLEALLRYKENGSTVELAGHDKIMGVDFYFIDVTDKAGRKTRFYISSKTYRVMMIDYEDNGVKYRRKFYDYNYAQGTLVPFRSTLTANDKIVEDSEVLTVTYGQKIDENLFKAG